MTTFSHQPSSPSAHPKRRLRGLVSLAAFGLVLGLAPSAYAQCTSNDANDCDGDGIPNAQDICPGLPGDGGSIHHGFVDARCYLPLVHAEGPVGGAFQGNRCTMVAARVVDDWVEKDPLRPKSSTHGGKEHIRGVTFVGVAPDGWSDPQSMLYRPQIGALSPASAADIQATFSGGDMPKNALFSCLASVEYSESNALTANPHAVYGYRVAAQYFRAVRQASTQVIHGEYFRDGLGLIRGIRKESSAWHDAIIGTNGLWWTDTNHFWEDQSVGLYDYEDLPHKIEKSFDRECVASAHPFWASALVDYKASNRQSLHKLVASWPEADSSTWHDFSQPFEDKSSYLASTEGKAMAARMTPFGPMVISKAIPTNGGGSTPGNSPSPTPKYGPADQYTEVAAVLTEADLQMAMADSGNVLKLPSCTHTHNGSGGKKFYQSCGCDVQVLGYTKGNVEHYSDYFSKENYADFFQDGSAPPRLMYPALAQFAVEIGGDKLNANTTDGKVELSTIAPFFKLETPILLQDGWQAPPGKSFHFTFGKGTNPKYNLGAYLRTPNKPGDDWLVLTGTGLAIIRKLRAAEAATSRVEDVVDGSNRRVAARFLGGNAHASYHKKEWSVTGVVPAGAIDYAEATVPLNKWSESQDYSFSGNEQAYINQHHQASWYHPGGDRWSTNVSLATWEAFKAKGRRFPFAHPNAGPADNDALPAWSPVRSDALDHRVQNYEARVAECNYDRYNPIVAERHWPRTHAKMPVAFRFGNTASKPAEGVVPRFANDLLFGMHEGLDVNWAVHEEQMEPNFAAQVGHVANTYCYGEFPLAVAAGEEIQLPMSCGESVVRYCGSDADAQNGCNPHERLNNEFNSACKSNKCNICSFPGCFIVNGSCKALTKAYNCAKGAINYIHGHIRDYVVDAVCSAGSLLSGGGAACTSEQLIVKRRHDGAHKREIELEMEHRLLMGKVDGLGDCGFWGKCGYDDFIQQNALWSPTSDWRSAYLGVNKRLNPAQIAIGASAHGALASSYVASGGQSKAENVIQPFSFAPGISAHPSAILGRVSLLKGAHHWPNPDQYSISIMNPQDVAHVVAGGEHPRPWVVEPQFRTEMLGDQILDCGHLPIRTELHPPTNIVTHLSTDNATNAKRYSVFAWRRVSEQESEVTPFDLWPGIRPPGKSQLKVNWIYGDGHPSSKGKIECTPVPANAPSHMRCRLVGGSAAGSVPASCKENQLMKPSCAAAVAGGIVEVTWE